MQPIANLPILILFQVVVAVFLTLLFWSLRSQSPRQKFFLWWSLGWTAYMLYLAAGGASLLFAPGGPLRIGTQALSSAFAFAQLPLLLYGVIALNRISSGKVTARKIALVAGFALLGAFIALLSRVLIADTMLAYQARSILRQVAMAATYFFCFAAFTGFWRSGKSWAAFITGVSCLLLAIGELRYVLGGVNVLLEAVWRSTFRLPFVSGQDMTWAFVNSFSELGIALGMVQLLLERDRQTSANLEASEEHFRHLVQNALHGIYRASGDRFLEVNPALVSMLGYQNEDDVLELSLSSDVWVDYRSHLEFIARDTQSADDPASHQRCEEARWRRRNGSVLYVSLTSHAVPDSTTGKVIYEGIAEDITERRRHDEALRESENMFRALAENTSAGIYIHDSRRFVYINPYLAESLGYTTEEILALNSIADVIHPEDRPVLADRIRRWLAGEHVNPRFDLRTVGKTGEIRYAQSAAKLIQFGGRPVLVGVVVDVTERVRAEEQLRQSQKMEAIGRLAGGIAHDFNNLLTVISGYSHLQQDMLPPEHPLHPAARHISEAAERAAALTSQLLAFGRQQILQPRILSLPTVILELSTLLRRLIGEDINFSLSAPANLGLVKVDRSQIEQVVMNLAVNARDAMPAGGNLSLEIANAEVGEERPEMQPGRYVVLSISDTGTGMDENTRARIFEPFFTTKGVGKGTGLGLSTVYGIVRQSGGFIFVDSEVGSGTTFTVYFPRVDVPGEVGPGEKTEDPPPPAAEMKPGTESVLLVEDDVDLRDLACAVLAEQGYKVASTTDPNQAAEASRKLNPPPQLLITDVVMPNMNGKALADQLMSLYPEMKVLYISGYTSEAIVHHGILDAGIQFLQKPFAPASLLTKVREILDGE